MPLPEVPPGEGKIPRQLVHAWWRSRVKSEKQPRGKLAEAAEKVFLRDAKKAGETDTAVMYADYAECDWFKVGGLPARWGSDRPDLLEQAIGDLRNRSALPCRELARLDLRLALFCEEGWLPDFALLGRRRLAEIALEEGELLALRLPDLAERPLDFAYDYFAGAVNDRVGALIAAICGATAALRCNLKGHVYLRLKDKIKPAYERLVSDAPWGELPSWQELQNLASNPRGDFQRLNHPVWGGWLHRLFRCLLFVEEGKVDKQVAWLARQYADGVPPELGFTAKEVELAGKMRRRAANPDRVLRACLRWSVILFILTMGSTIISLSLNAFNSQVAATSVYLLKSLLSLAGVGVAGRVGRDGGDQDRVRHPRRASPPRVDRQSRNTVSTFDLSATGPVQIRVLEFRSRNDSRPAHEIKTSTILPGLHRYRSAAAEIPAEIADVLARTRQRLMGNCWWNRLPISIVAKSNASSTAWEALSRYPFRRLFDKPGGAGFWNSAGALLFFSSRSD